jgi:hypothetical protein
MQIYQLCKTANTTVFAIISVVLLEYSFLINLIQLVNTINYKKVAYLKNVQPFEIRTLLAI